MTRCLILAMLVSSAACSKNDKPPPPSSGVPGAKPESGPAGGRPAGGGGEIAGPDAQQMFTQVCAACHGVDGTGNGPVAENLNPKPRNYTDPAWQASVTDDDIKKIILEGGQAVGKSPSMPAQAQLKDRPEVVDGLVKIIRGFAPKK